MDHANYVDECEAECSHGMVTRVGNKREGMVVYYEQRRCKLVSKYEIA